jgi:hypothetical protein
MRRFSTGLSMVALAATMSCLLLPHSSDSVSTHVATYKPRFSASGIDPMPVGTAKQMARIKRNRAERKA